MPSPREALQKFSAVILTGGSSGIGKSFIELTASLNPALVFCNLSRTKPGIIFPKLNLRHFPCDLSRRAEIEPAAAAVKEHLDKAAPSGRVLLVNNSGFGVYGCFPGPDAAEQGEMVDVNARAVVHLTGLLLPLLHARGGVIVNVASTAAFQPTPYLAVYGATKAFLLHWSLALGQELRGTGVTTLAVCPGPTDSQFYRRSGLPQGTTSDSLSMSCEAVVMDSLRALAAGRRQVVTGWLNKLSAIVGSTLPPTIASSIARVVIARERLNKIKR